MNWTTTTTDKTVLQDNIITTATTNIPNATIDFAGSNIRLNGKNFDINNITDSLSNYNYHSWTGNYLEEEKSNKMNNFTFGPAGDRAKISHLGIAIKNTNGEWVSYDKDSNTIVNVDLMNFGDSNFVYMIPVGINNIEKGDVILHNKQIMFVKKIKENEIKCIDITNGESKIILPTKSMFGFDFITKLISIFDLFGGAQASEDNPFGNILPFLLMNDSKDNILPLVMMLGMMKGNEPTTIAPLLSTNMSTQTFLPLFLTTSLNK